jgi:UDP-N-acetylmuramoylalanine-D-glutamate ligase
VFKSNAAVWLLTGDSSGYGFLRLSEASRGSNTLVYKSGTMPSAIKAAVNAGNNVQAFEDWTEAFKWLLEN